MIEIDEKDESVKNLKGKIFIQNFDLKFACTNKIQVILFWIANAGYLIGNKIFSKDCFEGFGVPNDHATFIPRCETAGIHV